jgi:hypothetical protein
MAQSRFVGAIDQLYECGRLQQARLTITSLVDLSDGLFSTTKVTVTLHKKRSGSCICTRNSKMFRLNKAEIAGLT